MDKTKIRQHCIGFVKKIELLVELGLINQHRNQSFPVQPPTVQLHMSRFIGQAEGVG